MDGIAAPRLGYFGTIDERLDFALLEKLADANPTWNITLIGPIERVEDDEMPQRANIHWLGAREYSRLPAYAKSFDACLLPFACNQATQFLNPTQTLEYLASGKPVISTALPEVQTAFAGALYLAHSHDDFLAQCRAALCHPDTAMLQSGLARANDNSWEAAVAKIETHLGDALLQNRLSRSGVRMPIRPMSPPRNAFAH
jgi:glycosyltransferase involved in cell wall biosynthesis